MQGLTLLASLTIGCTSGVRPSADPEARCTTLRERLAEAPLETLRHSDELIIVDCQLPGQMIGIGKNKTWATKPRAAFLSVWDCQLRGGQYAAADRENTLKTWQACAQRGDKIAQFVVGKIHDTGSVSLPDDATALE
ncbi:MAG: hypothetical protein ABFS02_04275 [Pseudomonadota bacterium]